MVSNKFSRLSSTVCDESEMHGIPKTLATGLAVIHHCCNHICTPNGRTEIFQQVCGMRNLTHGALYRWLSAAGAGGSGRKAFDLVEVPACLLAIFVAQKDALAPGTACLGSILATSIARAAATVRNSSFCHRCSGYWLSLHPFFGCFFSRSLGAQSLQRLQRS